MFVQKVIIIYLKYLLWEIWLLLSHKLWNRRTRIYRPRTQEILDNSAQRQYVSQEAVRLINENTGTELGKDIVDDFNKPKPSGGKRVKKNKITKRNSKQRTRIKRKLTRYRKIK
jgi:hypothetical protein